MSVLVEGISVIIRRDAIERNYPKGWYYFLIVVPNSPLCYDNKIARVGFMTPHGVGDFIQQLEKDGFLFLSNNKAIELAVADQQQGITSDCDWLKFG